MVKKKGYIYGVIFASIIVILFMWIVMAIITSSASVKVTAPSGFTNKSGTIIFNVSYSNTSADIIDPKNVTFYYNLSGTWAPISNATRVLNGSCFGASKSCFVILANGAPGYNLTDGRYGINASVDNGTDQVSVSLVANLSLEVIIDNTAPFQVNFTSPNVSSNYSGDVVINISTIDITSGIGAVMFNITNSTGHQNASLIGTREGSTNRWSTSISAGAFPDGTYNLTVFANDTTTGGNVNNTAKVTSLIFDTTKPTVSVECTPNPVSTGATVTCTCTRSDATSGINTVSITANPSTSLTGTFTSTCDVTDLAGNSASGSTQYTVEGSGGSTSSGGGGGGSSSSSTWTTYSVTDSAFDTGHTRELKENQRLKVNVETTAVAGGSKVVEEHFVGVVDISTTSAIVEVSSTPQRVTMSVGETRKFDVTGDNFYDVSVTLASIIADKAKITVLSIYEEIPAPAATQQAAAESAGEVATAPPVEGSKSGFVWMIMLIILIAAIVAIVAWVTMGKKKY